MSKILEITRLKNDNAIYYEAHYFNFVRDAQEFVNKSRSDATRRAYRTYLKEFFVFLEDKIVSEVTIGDVQRWFRWQESQGKSPNTLKTKLACVRSFFEHLKYFGHIETNPASVKAIAPPEVSDDLQGTALTPREVNILLTIPDTRKIIGARDYALMLLMLRTFMRVSEAVNLRESDFFYQKDSWYVRVKIKGGQIRQTPLPREVKKAIDHYHFLDREHRQMIHLRANDSRYIFMPQIEKKTRVNYNDNTHLTKRHVWHLVNRYGQLLFLDENLKNKKENEKGGADGGFAVHRTLAPHDFRRTAITRALDQGESYRRVQNAARLKSIATVQRYDQHRTALEENSILTLNYIEEDLK